MNVVALNGSPRRKGNSTILLEEFLRGVKESGSNAQIDEVIADKANIGFCKGCLKCNSVGHCVLKNDDWAELSEKILASDVLVFSSPIYFTNISAQLKRIIDRFRSLVHVLITKEGMAHKPWKEWKKDWVVILSYGSSADDEADHVKEFFEIACEHFGKENKLHFIVGKRLARTSHVVMTPEEMKPLYDLLKIPEEWIEPDCQRNRELMASAFKLGKELAAPR